MIKTEVTIDGHKIFYKEDKNVMLHNEYIYAIKTKSSKITFCYGSGLRYLLEIFEVLGPMHCIIGPAIARNKEKYFILNGLIFKNKEEWFSALNCEERQEAIWSL